MVLIREFEQEIHRLFLKGEVHGTTHLSAGQEAVPVGVCSALEPSDYVAGTYRGHGHALAKGTAPEPLAAEMLGPRHRRLRRPRRLDERDRPRARARRLLRDRRRQHRRRHRRGAHGQREGGVAVAFFGDGATNQGYFHECLNFAQVLRLPVVFVCENNFYGEFTPMDQVTAGARDRRARRGLRHARPGRRRQRPAGGRAGGGRGRRGRARSGGGPSLLECQTYRHYGHSKSDPATYRPKGELESWLERDPLIVTRARLVEAGVDGRTSSTRRPSGRRSAMTRASEAALAAPYPDPEKERATEFAS